MPGGSWGKPETASVWISCLRAESRNRRLPNAKQEGPSLVRDVRLTASEQIQRITVTHFRKRIHLLIPLPDLFYYLWTKITANECQELQTAFLSGSVIMNESLKCRSVAYDESCAFQFTATREAFPPTAVRTMQKKKVQLLPSYNTSDVFILYTPIRSYGDF